MMAYTKLLLATEGIQYHLQGSGCPVVVEPVIRLPTGNYTSSQFDFSDCKLLTFVIHLKQVFNKLLNQQSYIRMLNDHSMKMESQKKKKKATTKKCLAKGHSNDCYRKVKFYQKV